MEWTKIKPKYFLFDDFNLKEHGALARILCLTAHLERFPSASEIARQVPEHTLSSVQSKLDARSTPLQAVLEKVLEDVNGIEHKRKVSRATSSRYREKQALPEKESDVSHDTTEKRREEKRREDKIREVKKTFDFEAVWNKYPKGKKIGKSEALGYFNTTVKTDQDYANIQKALDNYTNSQRVQDKYIKDGCNWFSGWEQWVDYQEEPPVEKEPPIDYNAIKASIMKQLGKMATEPMIEKCMRGIPEKAWWMVDKALKALYSPSPAFGKVEAKLIRERHDKS